ncbi:chromosome partitioning protein, ParB family [Rhizobium sp. NFR07]|uniref:plasmid partitioning protein RepB n=1 Tax=Rhizobium sp. NFR07 TaxID=1566262 RepID=UPI0008E81365|nr:plasmid partitioning protein RepB [Rhizobium sp. NFR07]SFB59984.1 chromosome partitioning protein, ParB family [Rhizobium sp. NFR07]
MARKNLLEGLADLPEETGSSTVYPMRGAGRSLVRSLGDLAQQADKFLEGQAVVDLDPSLIDASFIQDRLRHDGDDFEELLSAIREHGQDSPILVRPHADAEGRYQVVFGHRRLRVARELGRSVRAVVRQIDDRSHVIAQGQENSARANLSFVERALFAMQLDRRGYGRDIISTALASNKAAVSKMISVTERIPQDVIAAVGAAPGIGRERWIELSLLVGKGNNLDTVRDLVSRDHFLTLGSDDRFIALFRSLNDKSRPVKKFETAAPKATWVASDNSVRAEFKGSGRNYSISLKSGDAARFGRYVAENLERLHAEFLTSFETEGK